MTLSPVQAMQAMQTVGKMSAPGMRAETKRIPTRIVVKKSDEDSDYWPEESSAEKEAVLEKQPESIQRNREGGYGKGSRARTERKKKFANELKKEVSKIYNIMALWQRNRDLGIISEANTQSWLAKDSESGPTPEINPLYPLSQVPSGSNPPQSSQEIEREGLIVALKDITRLV